MRTEWCTACGNLVEVKGYRALGGTVAYYCKKLHFVMTLPDYHKT